MRITSYSELKENIDRHRIFKYMVFTNDTSFL